MQETSFKGIIHHFFKSSFFRTECCFTVKLESQQLSCPSKLFCKVCRFCTETNDTEWEAKQCRLCNGFRSHESLVVNTQGQMKNEGMFDAKMIQTNQWWFFSTFFFSRGCESWQESLWHKCNFQNDRWHEWPICNAEDSNRTQGIQCTETQKLELELFSILYEVRRTHVTSWFKWWKIPLLLEDRKLDFVATGKDGFRRCFLLLFEVLTT